MYYNKKYEEILLTNFRSVEEIDNVLALLREAGASQIHCVFALVRHLKLPLPKADELVLNSETWRDKFEETEKLRDDIFDTLSNLDEFDD